MTKIHEVASSEEIKLDSLSYVPKEFFVGSKRIFTNWQSSYFREEEQSYRPLIVERQLYKDKLKNQPVFGFEEVLSVITRVITNHSNRLTKKGWNIFYAEDQEYFRVHPFTMRVFWLEKEKMWGLTGKKPFYTDNQEDLFDDSLIFTYSRKNLTNKFLEMKNGCVTKIRSTKLPKEIIEELLRNLEAATNESLDSVLECIVSKIRIEASKAMDNVCKYEGAGKTLEQYNNLYSAWCLLLTYHKQQFPNYVLRESVLKDPGQM